MTPTELKKLRKDLEGRLSELATGDRAALTVEASSDEMDQIQRFSEREYAMNHLERNSKQQREVKEALQRMDEGTFGVCADCEEKIGLKRLAAVPWASTCITCQEGVERAGAGSGMAIDTQDVVAA
jgi:DnaK suppressor protein